MSRKRTAVNEHALLLLKHLVKARLNLDCSTFSHIQQLQEDIKQTTGEYLSLQTLNRFFGIIQNDFNPSINTLNTFSKYVDYQSFFEFEQFNPLESLVKEQSSALSRFIVSIFSSISPEASLEPGILVVARNTVKIMKEDRRLASQVYYAMAPHPTGRKYFFEQFINIDALDKEYGDGLRYYLLHAETREQKFFAYNIYCYRYFLTGNIPLFQKYFTLLGTFGQSEILTFHPLFIDRYYATCVFNQVIRKAENGQSNGLTDTMADLDMLSSHAKSFCYAGYLVGEALLLAGEYGRAWDILNSDEIKPASLPACLQEEFITRLDIFKLLSGLLSNHIRVKKALSLYAELSAKPLPVLSQDYLSFFLLLLKRNLFPRPGIRKEICEHMSLLVQKTGFHYLTGYEQLVCRSDSNLFKNN
jgi:hypothetical protein